MTDKSVIIYKLKNIIQEIDKNNNKNVLDRLYPMQIHEIELENILPYKLFKDFCMNYDIICFLLYNETYTNYNNIVAHDYRYSALKILNYLKYEKI